MLVCPFKDEALAGMWDPRGLLDFGSRTVPMLSHEKDTSGCQFVIEFLSMSFVRRSSIDGIPYGREKGSFSS